MARSYDTPQRVAPDVERGVPFPISSGTAELRDEPDGSTSVWVNNVPSSSLRPELDVLDFEYMRHCAAAIGAWPVPDTLLALHIGAGACTLPRYLCHEYPSSRHIAVDIDTTLPDLVRQWWDLPRAPRLRVRAIDGLEFLAARHDASADVIVRDAFAGDTTPGHLADAGFYAQAKRVLRGHGLVLANVGCRPGSETAKRDVDAMREHFTNVYAIGDHAVLKGKRIGNVVLAAGAGLSVRALERYAASAPLPTGVRANWLH